MKQETLTTKKYWAGGFLYDPGTSTVLLHKRDANTHYNPNKWAFFGGLNEGEESPPECYARELREEIGLDIDPANIIPLCEYFNDEFSTYRVVFYSISNVHESKLRLTEGADFAWIGLDSLDQYDLTEKSRRDLDLFKKRIPSGK